VLAFRKPLGVPAPKGDPDLPAPLAVSNLLLELPLAQCSGEASVVFFGLDRGRAILPALREKLPASTRLFDVIIQEWALSSDESHLETPVTGVEVPRMEKGGRTLPADTRVSLVVFADIYHRVWEPLPLLKHLRECMSGSARIAVIDRQGPDPEPRHVAGHRRRISASLVIEDLQHAGFQLREKIRAQAADRFFLLFEPRTEPADRALEGHSRSAS